MARPMRDAGQPGTLGLLLRALSCLLPVGCFEGEVGGSQLDVVVRNMAQRPCVTGRLYCRVPVVSRVTGKGVTRIVGPCGLLD